MGLGVAGIGARARDASHDVAESETGARLLAGTSQNPRPGHVPRGEKDPPPGIAPLPARPGPDSRDAAARNRAPAGVLATPKPATAPRPNIPQRQAPDSPVTPP